jgi:hypothetical protein
VSPTYEELLAANASLIESRETLQRRMEEQRAHLGRLNRKLTSARVWARRWKRAAKYHRGLEHAERVIAKLLRLRSAERGVSVGSALAWISFLREGAKKRNWSYVDAAVEGAHIECLGVLSASAEPLSAAPKDET